MARWTAERAPRGPISAAILLTLLVSLLMTLPSSGPGAGRSTAVGGRSVGPIGTHSGSTMVREAVSSLSRGVGPAHGVALACSGSGSSRCGSHPMVHPLGVPKAYWINVSGSHAPSDRETAALTYDAADGYVLLFGGGQWRNGVDNNETWRYTAGVWTQVNGPGPSARMGAEMTYDAADGYVVLFGGYNQSVSAFDGDTWEYVAGVWTPLSLSSHPSSRWGMGMSYDAADGYVLLFGGEGGFGYYQSDTWKFVGGSWTKLSPTSAPSARGDINMAYDSTEKDVLLYSGEAGSSGTYNDTWNYSNGNWTDLTSGLTLEPDVQSAAALSDDPQYRGVVLEEYTTFSGGPTFIFSAGKWTKLAPTTIPPGQAHSKATFDAGDGYLLLFGGQPVGSTYDTWNFSWLLGPNPLIVGLSVSPGALDTGATLRLTISVEPATKGVAYSYAGLPAGCLSANVSTLTCSPTQTGTFLLNGTAKTPGGTTVTTANSTLVVGSPPLVGGLTITPAVVTEGRPVNFSATGVSGTGPLSYAYAGVPYGCPSVNRSSYACLPTENGWFNVTVSVTDPRHGSAFAMAPLRVNPYLTLTVPTVSPSNVIDKLEAVTFSAIPGGGTPPITFTYTGLPPGCLSTDLPTLNCTPSSTGVFAVILNASDGSGEIAKVVLGLTVFADPMVGPLVATPRAIDLGSTLAFAANFTGGIAPTTISWHGLPPGCTSGGSLSLLCVPTASGTYHPVITVTDSAGFSTNATTNVTVSPLPRIIAVSYPSGGWDVDRAFPITVSATGGSGTLVYGMVTAGSARTCVAGATPNVTLCTASQPGTLTFKASVADALGHNASFSGIILLHSLPSIVGFLPTPATATVGEPVNFSFGVAGGTGILQYHLGGFQADCGLLTPPIGYACQTIATGTFNVTLTVTDAVGAAANASAIVIISSAHPTVVAGGSSPLSGLDLALLVVAAVAVVGALVFVGLRGRRTPVAYEPPAPPPPEGPSEVSEPPA
jgi:hypothetical protein